MQIKGFIGFWGNREENLISRALCDTYVEIICNSVLFCKERYTIIASSDYLSHCSGDCIDMTSGICQDPDSKSLAVFLKIAPEQLSVERDRWGTRTAYYCCVGKNIYFSSDIRFLLALPVSGIRVYDEASLMESAALGYLYEEERTLFQNIKQFPRNSKCTFQDGRLEINRTVISCNKERFATPEEAFEAFSDAFETAVSNTKWISGRKAYPLSGGMDSSAIAIAAAKHMGNIDTLAFASENNTEDTYYAAEVSRLIGSHHTVLPFHTQTAMSDFPAFLNHIENVEFHGIFSPLGGYSYYLMCKEIARLGYCCVFPGEGADELLGGYYWQMTHTFGFVDRLKTQTEHTPLYSRVVGLFPEVEERSIYRELAYYFLQGSALTNYHLSCIEHTAKACGLYNYPIFMSDRIYQVIKDVPMSWLCDGQSTKLLMRNYLSQHLAPVGLSNLITRKKLAMPSVVTASFTDALTALATMEARHSDNPFRKLLKEQPLNIMMLDVFHKYYTCRPLDDVCTDEWQEDMLRIKKDERIIHW